jgi:hypothetical protein
MIKKAYTEINNLIRNFLEPYLELIKELSSN